MNKFKWFKKFFKDDFTDKLYFGDDTINVFKENSNYLIVGPNGSGKNLNFFTPNIINQTNNSIVSLDFDKRLYNKCKKSLEDNGYKVYYLDSENFFDNIFFHSKVFVGIKTSDNDEITETLNKFYDIKDEDDYYSNIEISLLRAIAKELLLDRKSIFIRDIFSFWSNLDFDDIEKSFKHFEDEYINEHLDDFISFTKDIGLKGFKFLKEKITKKFIEDENDLNNFNFNILRDEKIALFFETSSHYHNDIYLSPLIRVLFNQIISKFEGLKISIFLDDFCCLKDFDMLKEILFLSRGRNYLLYI